MSAELTCGDPARLVGYLYGECDAAERAAIEAHLDLCASCASEVKALGATRTALASWSPPDVALGFRITSARDRDDERPRATSGVDDSTRVLRPARWWQRPLPAWAQAAAALLIFTVGMTLGVRARPTPEGTSEATPAVNQTASRDVPAVTAGDLAALEARLRAEVSTLREATTVAARETPAASTDDAVLQRVRTLVSESEERQRRELALRVGQLVRDVDRQRRMDLLRIEQTFGQMEGITRPELADQRQMINYLYQRAGFQRAPQE